MVSKIITSANGKNKVIDFRDGLNLALPEHYATIHQIGGKKNSEGQKTYPSVIRIVLCDFTKGTGNASITVSVNVEPSLPYEWLEICKQSLGEIALPFYSQNGKNGLQENTLGRMRSQLHCASTGARAVLSLFQGAVNAIADMVTGKTDQDPKGPHKAIGSAVKNAKSVFATTNQPNEAGMKLPRGIDYIHTQDKVNVYKKGQDGYAPVTQLQVTRQTFRSDGSMSMYPWTIKVINGEAVVDERDTGATTFRAKSMRNRKEAFIMLSDRDMFRMMTRITHFVDVWETAYGIPLVAQGMQLLEQEQANRQVQASGQPVEQPDGYY